MSDLDSKLIGGKFMEDHLSPEFSYLHKYFLSELGRAFISYYFAFNDLIALVSIKFFLDNFVDHTGFTCSEQRLRYLLKRLQCLLEVTKQAELNFDLEQLETVKSGKYKFT